MGIPLVAVGAGVSGFIKGKEQARIESHIQDRVKRYQSATNEQLDLWMTLGGETAEAARRVRASRPGGQSATSQSAGTTTVDRLAGITNDKSTLFILAGVGLLALVLLKRK